MVLLEQESAEFVFLRNKRLQDLFVVSEVLSTNDKIKTGPYTEHSHQN